MGNKNKTDKRHLKDLEKKAIPISRFISKYLGIQDMSLLCAEMSHEALALMFPYLKRSSFSYILDNPDEIYNGNVVLVYDCLGKYIPYSKKELMAKIQEQKSNNESIPISNFINQYLGINECSLLCKNLSHTFLKNEFPELKRTSFDYILDNPGELHNGNVVIVSDCTGERIPYVVGGLLEELKRQGLDYVMNEDDWKSGTPESCFLHCHEDSCLSDLSVYELEQLMTIYKKAKDFNGYNRIRRELVNREDSKRANRLSKQKALRRSAKKFDDE